MTTKLGPKIFRKNLVQAFAMSIFVALTLRVAQNMSISSR